MDLFGGTRDDMIKTNLKEWLGQNRIYPGVAQALQKAVSDHEVYIVTTKQASRQHHGWALAQQHIDLA